VALSDDYDFRSEPTGPKSFTEYSFGAIIVLIAQIGSFLCVTSQFSVALPIAWVIPIVYTGAELTSLGLTGVSMLAFLIGIFQLHLGYQLHKQGFQDDNRIEFFNIIIILIEISIYIMLAISLNVLLILVFLQVSIGIIILNIVSIYFLRDEEVQKEFRGSRVLG